MFNVIMNTDRLKEQFHQDTIILVCHIFSHNLLCRPDGRPLEMLVGSHDSQFSFPDFRWCKYFVLPRFPAGK